MAKAGRAPMLSADSSVEEFAELTQNFDELRSSNFIVEFWCYQGDVVRSPTRRHAHTRTPSFISEAFTIRLHQM